MSKLNCQQVTEVNLGEILFLSIEMLTYTLFYQIRI